MAKSEVRRQVKKVRKKAAKLIDDLPSLSEVADSVTDQLSSVTEQIGDATKNNRKNRKDKKKCCRRFRGILLVVGIISVIGYLVKSILESKDDGWTEYQPSEPYTPKDSSAEEDSACEKETPEDSNTGCDETDLDPKVAEAAETADADESEDEFPNGYVGENPPEGFEIKAKRESMKYHLVGNANYARTEADVWFKSEKDAEDAGFTKAMR